jgi:hypothetical protein
MWRTLNSRTFVGGFASGVALCFLVFGPVFVGVRGGAETALAAAQGNRAALESCTQKLVDVNSRWTLIMDTPAGAVPAAQVLDGLVAVGPGKMLTAGAGPYPRWEVPAKVVPFVAGPRDRAVYYWWDPKTTVLDGPHIPEETHAGQNP